MALTWQPNYIQDINEGTTANDGTGDTIRDAFLKVDSNFQVLTAFLNGATVTAGDYSSGPAFNTLTINTLTSNIGSLGNITLGNINSQSTFHGNLNAGANIVPIGAGLYDLGSPSNPFRTLYVQATVATSQVQTSTDAGLLVVHANATTGDQQDVGIFGNVYHSYGANTYTFFGFQKQTNNFVYKITPTNATKGNSVVYDGIYGNVHAGSLFLSNTTQATSNVTGALIVAGGISSNAEIRARGNVWSAGYKVLTTSDVDVLGYPTYSGSGSLFLGTTTFPAAVPSTSSITGAITVPNGGIGVGGNVNAGGFVGNFWGNITNPVQTGITTVGSLGNLTVLGTTSTSSLQATSVGATNVLATFIQGTSITGSTVSATSINAATIGNLGAVLTGTLSTAAQPNVTSLGTLTSLNVSGNITAGNVSAAKGTFTQVQGTLLTAAQPNITSLGTLTGLAVSGNTFVNNTFYAQGVHDNSSRVVSASAGSPGAGNITINSNGTAYLTQTGPGAVTTGSATAVPVITTDSYGRISSITTAAVSSTLSVSGTSGTGSVSLLNQTLGFSSTNGVTTSVSGQTVSINTPQDLRTTAAPTFAGLTSTGNITVTGSVSPSANVAHNLGSATAWWNTVFGRAVQAQYADLAEKYTSDEEYEPGTVVIFGGSQEVTVTTEFADTRVAGAVSTNPAYLMNADEPGLAIALRGRVPVKVYGPVSKGDCLVTSDRPGYAVSVGRSRDHGSSVFAKSLEDNQDPGVKIITAVIL